MAVRCGMPEERLPAIVDRAMYVGKKNKIGKRWDTVVENMERCWGNKKKRRWPRKSWGGTRMK